MLGAIIGDIVGSRFEWHNHKSKDFELFSPKCHFTDDSVMTLAICSAILKEVPKNELAKETVDAMQKFGKAYPKAGYGRKFFTWIFTPNPKPYESYGNGAAMRVSACGYAGNSLEEALTIARCVTEVTHNHPEGIKAAAATTHAIYLARNGKSKEEIKNVICSQYYPISFTVDDIRPRYTYDISSQGTVPQALEAFFEAEDFEDTIRIAISLGGDSDTLAAIAGSVAEAYFGIPHTLREKAFTFLDKNLKDCVLSFEKKYPPKIVNDI